VRSVEAEGPLPRSQDTDPPPPLSQIRGPRNSQP